jgi:predicted GNAT superfamily acetyltransferase
MPPAITIRDLTTFDDLQQATAVEQEVWAVSDRDAVPITLAIATQAAGSLWLGAFDGPKLVGFAFAFLATERGRVTVHSHQLAVLPPYRDLDLGYKLKLAQRERALALRIETAPAYEFRNPNLPAPALRIEEMTWTFDPLQSKNAHLNFAKLGVISDRYKADFYGPETSSVLHRNGTDRLWVRWPLPTRRVQMRLQGKDNRAEMLDALSTLQPVIQFNGDKKPARMDLPAALARQRMAIEIPSDIAAIEKSDAALAGEWRQATRWAFTAALQSGFFVAEFCRTVRGQQGPGVYILEKGSVEEYVPELARGK